VMNSYVSLSSVICHSIQMSIQMIYPVAQEMCTTCTSTGYLSKNGIWNKIFNFFVRVYMNVMYNYLVFLSLSGVQVPQVPTVSENVNNDF